MVHEDVTAPDLREELVRVGCREETRMHDRIPRLLLEVRAVDRDELLQLSEVEQARDQIDLLGAGAQTALEPFEHPLRDRAGDLDAHDVAESPPPQLVLHRLEQVVCLVRHFEVRVACHAKCGALDDLHAGKQAWQKVPDDTLEGKEEPARADREEARKQLGDLDAGKPLLARVRVADEDAEAQRQR